MTPCFRLTELRFRGPESGSSPIVRVAVSNFHLAFILGWLCSGCGSAPEARVWQSSQAKPRPVAEREDFDADLTRIRMLRDGLDLSASRALALHVVAERPDDGRALLAASIAESDGVFLYSREEQESRDLAALSSLDYARRAVTRLEEEGVSVSAGVGAPGVEARAQLAYALGTTTHLQPMFDRSRHAGETLSAIEDVLVLEPENVVALATLSTLRLRLATLPWIARAMAWGAPHGDLDEAIDTAQRAAQRVPSLEYRLLLARVHEAREEPEEALSVLRMALAAEPKHPRDKVLRGDAEALLARLGGR
jgi:tetratricopeptide (TPR) repeat protein